MSELGPFLQSLGIVPRKGLSQNFLIDGNILRKIAAAGNVGADDLVLEIGPGPGALTEILLQTKGGVLAVEKDPILAQALSRFSAADNQLEIFCQDILDFPLAEVLQKRLLPGKKAKVIANLPYHVTTPILIKLVVHHQLISTLVLMVQEEVARRMTASAGSKEYGSLTVFLNYFADVEYGFKVSRSCFFPAPKVDSAVVILYPKPPPLLPELEVKFFLLTRTAFQQRRKMLRKSLKELYSGEDISKILELQGLSPAARPEEVSLENFLNLFLRLEEKGRGS